jgi:hypothetical protein
MAGEVAGQVSTVSTAWAVFSVIGGTLVGSAISTAVAFWTQKRTFAAAKEQRESDRLETRKAKAYSLFFKMIRMHSNIATMDANFVSFIEKGRAKGYDQMWKVVLPMNMPDKVKLTPDEMALVLSMDIKLFNDMGPFDDVHNSLIDIYAEYSSRRTAVLSKFGADEMDGSAGSTTLSAAEMAWLRPRAYELEELAKRMVQRATEERAESQSLLERIHALFVKEFDFSPKLEFLEPTV